MSLFGGIASAVGSIAGGLLGNAAAASSQANAQAINRFNYDAQKEFAQNGIRWRVQDAKAAGLHPLAALGASGASYSPSAVVGGQQDYSWLGDAGQGIGRAIDAKMTQKERMQARLKEDEMWKLQLQNRTLQNQYLETQIAAQKQDMVLQLARSAAMAARTQQAVPAMPGVGGSAGSGQGDFFPTGEVKVDVSKVPTSVKGDPSTQAGVPPDARMYRALDGARIPIPTSDMADSLDAVWPFGAAQWFFRNNFIPWMHSAWGRPDSRRRPGEVFDIFMGGYRRQSERERNFKTRHGHWFLGR